MSALAEALVAAQRRAMQAEWEPDERAEPLEPDFLALFYGDEPAR